MVASCSWESPIEWDGKVTTRETNQDGFVQAGEATEPELDCHMVESGCTGDIDVEWEACFMVKIEGQELIVVDEGENWICGSYATKFRCEGQTLVKSERRCAGNHCTFSIPSDLAATACGWRLISFATHGEDGANLGSPTNDQINRMGYEMLPVKP
ncbi:MAG TPA: hypothetical protein PK156_38425 [Polyangium sp.]|nr:hypothetical protein [Polyangium sp.]